MITPEQYEAWANAIIAEWKSELAAVNERWSLVLRAGPAASASATASPPRDVPSATPGEGASPALLDGAAATGPSWAPQKKRLLPGKQNTVVAFAAEARGGEISIDDAAGELRASGVEFSGKERAAAANALRYLRTLGFMTVVDAGARDGTYRLSDEGRRAVDLYRGKYGPSPLSPRDGA